MALTKASLSGGTAARRRVVTRVLLRRCAPAGACLTKLIRLGAGNAPIYSTLMAITRPKPIQKRSSACSRDQLAIFAADLQYGFEFKIVKGGVWVILPTKSPAGRSEIFRAGNFPTQRAPRNRAFQRMKMRAWQRAVHRGASLVHGKSARLNGERQREGEIPAQVRQQNKSPGQASAADLLRGRRWTGRSSLYCGRWSWRSYLSRRRRCRARHLRLLHCFELTLVLAL
jgi:hypothetical protein